MGYRGNKGVVVYPSNLEGVYLDIDSIDHVAFLGNVKSGTVLQDFVLPRLSPSYDDDGNTVKHNYDTDERYVFVHTWGGKERNVFISNRMVALAAYSDEATLNHFRDTCVNVVRDTAITLSPYYGPVENTTDNDESASGSGALGAAALPVQVGHEYEWHAEAVSNLDTFFAKHEAELEKYLDEKDNRVLVFTTSGEVLFDNTKTVDVSKAENPGRALLDSLDDEF